MEKEKSNTNEDAVEETLVKSTDDININVMTRKQKMQYLKSNITVEPILTLFMVPSVLSLLAAQNLYIDKACRVNLEYGDEVCLDLRLRKTANHTIEELGVQKLIASVQAWRSVIYTIVPTVLMLFVGAWSDKTGRRKICMLMPIFAEFMTCMINLINTYFFYEISVEWTVILDILFPSLTGGWYTMFLGTFSYLCDITSKETRTFRLGILSLCLTIGFPIGMGFSGVLLKYLGFYGVFSIAGGIHLFNFCYLYLNIEDHTWLEDKDKKKRRGFFGFLSEFFDFNSLKETMGIVFKKGRNNRRLQLCLILTCVCLHFGPLMGELSVMYIFVRYRFNWDEVKYSIYSTYSLIMHLIGTVFSISVFSKKMKAHDSVLGIISASSKIAGALVLTFAVKDYQAYLCPLVEVLNGTAAIALRSLSSKLVSYQELGKLNSLFGMVETIMPLIYAPIYTKVYVASLHILPGTVFLLSIASTIPVLVIFSWFYHEHRKSVKEKEMQILAKPEECDDKNENDAMLVKNSQVECLLHEVKAIEQSNGSKTTHESNKV
ncbi:PREDICTED: proton-coupled folate transporter-like [Papilio xuthus]|uniref:Proton-coupled folate transporter-like n=2 Tax=Papilio xuthus TaxID=66420 RepID=A0AAJ6ZSK1_PAPXU|nr:PREDICTED: proton-coupled folate transporter-like [Papilio xuthus]